MSAVEHRFPELDPNDMALRRRSEELAAAGRRGICMPDAGSDAPPVKYGP